MNESLARWRQWCSWTVSIKVWKIAVASLATPVLVLWALVARQIDDIVVLVRNEVVNEPSGQRTWYGTYLNGDHQTYRDVAVTIQFLDGHERVVGRVDAQTEELPGGGRLEFQTPLPTEAVQLRVYSVRWRTDTRATMYGPFREPWQFGYLQANPAQR